MSPNELSSVVRACTEIGNEAVDETGFVAIRRLLDLFQAELLIRPLLVEAMVATRRPHQLDSVGAQWVVVLDSETHSVNREQIAAESRESPLPSRVRNSIAHELVHSLAFRPSEFGIHLQSRRLKNQSENEFVKAIERDTERLSPLLLWPERSMRTLFSARDQAASAATLTAVRRAAGISRYVLVNRLCLLHHTDRDNLLQKSPLRNTAVLLGHWTTDGEGVMRKWPLFINFDRNIIPSFLLRLRNQDSLPAKTVFQDPRFTICGGDDAEIELITDAGTPDFPAAERMHVKCSVEHSLRRERSSFLLMIHKLDV